MTGAVEVKYDRDEDEWDIYVDGDWEESYASEKEAIQRADQLELLLGDQP